LVFPKNVTIFSINPSQSALVVSSSEEDSSSEEETTSADCEFQSRALHVTKTSAGHFTNTCSEFEPSENLSRLISEWNLKAPY